MGKLYVGLDCSTQSLSALVLDADGAAPVCEKSLNFEREFAHWGVRDGVLPHADARVAHAPPLLWVEALVRLFDSLKSDGLPMGDIAAISGSAQQHGSVYLNERFSSVLKTLGPRDNPVERLAGALARPVSPIWMDSSTACECAEIEAALGGPAQAAALTGSAVFERFTGPQIRKFYKEAPDAYADTAHIALISSFLASLLAGRIVPVDFGDGSGMNLMDIARREWSEKALAATAPDLAARLPPPIASCTVVGCVAPVWRERWGLSPDTRIVAWSGDNPNSLVGTGLAVPGRLAISLGTSDTCFGPWRLLRTDPSGGGHVFGSPTGDYMSLICFRNGSLAREAVRVRYGMTWPQFSAALRCTPPGNGGALMLPWFAPEIVPRVRVPGAHRIRLDESDAAANCRAVIEGQALSMRRHSAWMGARPDRLYATGGASANREILQVVADVHRCPVYRHEAGNSAALGAAMRALHAAGEGGEWEGLIARYARPPSQPVAVPDPRAAACYDEAEQAYGAAEERALRKMAAQGVAP